MSRSWWRRRAAEHRANSRSSGATHDVVDDDPERGRTPMSTFVNAFEECGDDASAAQPGDNAGCDRMYELFGFFCGNRLVPEQQSDAVAGYCELM